METLEELRSRLAEIKARLQEIDTEFAGQALPEDSRDEWNRLNEEHDETNERIAELEARTQRIEELSSEDGAREEVSFQTRRAGSATQGDIYDLSTIRATAGSLESMTSELRDRAKVAIERASFPHTDRERAQAEVERLLEKRDTKDGELSRRLLLTGSPTYRRAFGKRLMGEGLSSEEERALTAGTGSEGGFAVPFTLDPTVIPTSNHSVNPYRAISRVEQITTTTWQGVTSDGITVSRSAEAAEVGDDSPTLAQPEITPTRVTGFVPFSVEVGQDWSGLQAEVATMLQDAKDDEEATSFSTGSGTGVNPQGVVTGATITVPTAGTATLAVGDVYATEEALPPRFRPRAQFVANRSIYNLIRQFDTSGGAQLWTENLQRGLANNVPTPGNTGYNLLGYGANEASALDSDETSGNEILVIGDFSYYVIVDRIGMSIELVPHLFHTGNNRPSGQRGLLAIWRNSAEVVSPNAFRILQVT